MRRTRPPRPGDTDSGRRRLRADAATVRARRKLADPERWLYGKHAVAAALANPERCWHRLAVLAEQQAAAAALAAAAAAVRRGKGEAVQVVDRAALALLLPEGAVHQGWAIEVEPLAERDLDDILRQAEMASGRCILVLLDQVTDPHNVGAVLRSAAAFGALAVIVTAHHAPPATALVAKAASGGLECVPLLRVANLAHTIDRLKAADFWSCGLDEGAAHSLASLDLGRRAVLVLGAEGGGLRRLVRERCDHLARLPTRAAMASLNVSNAAAVALYELVRADPAG